MVFLNKYAKRKWDISESVDHILNNVPVLGGNAVFE